VEAGVSAPDFGMVGWSLSDRERDAVAALRERAALQVQRDEAEGARRAASEEADRLYAEVQRLNASIAAASQRVLCGAPVPSATAGATGAAAAVVAAAVTHGPYTRIAWITDAPSGRWRSLKDAICASRASVAFNETRRTALFDSGALVYVVSGDCDAIRGVELAVAFADDDVSSDDIDRNIGPRLPSGHVVRLPRSP
jgi:hypothetical protein